MTYQDLSAAAMAESSAYQIGSGYARPSTFLGVGMVAQQTWQRWFGGGGGGRDEESSGWEPVP